MERSQYLAQALQSMSADPGVQTGQAPDLAAMQKQMQARQAWEAQNPGQPHMTNGMRQMGQNLMQAPGNMMAGMAGLFRMGKS